MRHRLLVALACVLAGAYVYAQAQTGTPAQRLILSAAEALGGRDRLMAVTSIKIEGYGQTASQNGGGNISASLDAPQKWINIVGHLRWIDLANGRMRMQQRQANDFVFAYERNMRGIPGAVQGIDGDIAYNIAADGQATRAGGAAVRQRRIEMLNNPVSIIRMALNPATKIDNLRAIGTTRAVDLTTPQGDPITLAIDNETQRPAWMSWVEGNTNLGDLTFRTTYTAYQPTNGVQMPSGYQTTIDWRNVVVHKLMVDRTEVDAPIPVGSRLDLEAPASVRTPPPAQAGGGRAGGAAGAGAAAGGGAGGGAGANIEVVAVAPRIWYLKGAGNSTAFEFDDHITLYEVYASEANALAIIARARTLVPGKPVTQVIVSHHHFDHSGGLRAAVAEGLAIITQRGNAEIFREMASRPARLFPDALGRNPKPITIIPVDDRLVLKDNTNEVHVLRGINNSHMADSVIAYAPAARVVAQGDMVDQAWDVVWWGNSFPDTVKYWNIQVDRDLAVHGDINTWAQTLANLRKQAAQAKAFCDAVASVNLSMPGCPATNVGF